VWGQTLWPLSVQGTERGAVLACHKHIARAERDMGIPKGLLSAISIIESGKKTKEFKDLVAWPWVLNVDGKPEFHKSKTDAVKSLHKHLERGIVNIDVGCMQVNFRHHGSNFRTPSQMMDPAQNVAYAAKFLLSLRQNHGSWTKAVGHYHSATMKFQIPYRHKVYNKWQKVRHDQKNRVLEMFENAGGEVIPRNVVMSAQAKRLFGPLAAKEHRHGYEIIRPQNPMVQVESNVSRNSLVPTVVEKEPVEKKARYVNMRSKRRQGPSPQVTKGTPIHPNDRVSPSPFETIQPQREPYFMAKDDTVEPIGDL
jgi:hypothetical protein